MMRRVPEPDALLMLIGGWFGLLLVASLAWMMLALLSYHGAASDAAVFIFGPATLSFCFGLAAFVAWLGRHPGPASSAIVTTMVAVLGLLLYGIGTLE